MIGKGLTCGYLSQSDVDKAIQEGLVEIAIGRETGPGYHSGPDADDAHALIFPSDYEIPPVRAPKL